MKLVRTFTVSAAALSAVVAALGGGCSSSDPGLGQPDASITQSADAAAPGPTAPGCDKTVCGGSCVDTQIDPKNCGACGTGCSAGLTCQAGVCALGCAGGTSRCGDACVDMQVDKANCGACGTACAAGTVCSNGACKVTCDSNLTTCGAPDGGPVDGGPTGAYCANAKTDNANCGACGTTCAAGEACVDGACKLNCGGGQTACTPNVGAPYCATLDSDRANCGACGTTCADGQVCSNGGCKVTCDANLTKCDAVGGGQYCAAVKTDNANCGTCGTTCLAGQACVDGACTVTCGDGQLVCNDGCVDPKTNPKYCGATAGCGGVGGSAGVDCGATKACVDGACTVVCGAGQVVCNGACVDPKSSNTYCGATAGCGAAGGSAGTDCGNTKACVGGSCQPLVPCGTDCWSEEGCKTAAGRCVRFSCRPGSAGDDFCDTCTGWSEISRDQWLNQGYCGDITAIYRAGNGFETKCGGSGATCCGTSAACAGGDNAWHFRDGADTYYLGPPLGGWGDPDNCTYWNGVNNSDYTRITACERR